MATIYGHPHFFINFFARKIIIIIRIIRNQHLWHVDLKSHKNQRKNGSQRHALQNWEVHIHQWLWLNRNRQKKKKSVYSIYQKILCLHIIEQNYFILDLHPTHHRAKLLAYRKEHLLFLLVSAKLENGEIIRGYKSYDSAPPKTREEPNISRVLIVKYITGKLQQMMMQSKQF